MNAVEKELSLLADELRRTRSGAFYNELYAAQQAIMWVSNPTVFESPHHMLMRFRVSRQRHSAKAASATLFGRSPKRLSVEAWAKIEAVCRTKSLRELGEEFGVSAEGIRVHLKKRGLTTRGSRR